MTAAFFDVLSASSFFPLPLSPIPGLSARVLLLAWGVMQKLQTLGFRISKVVRGLLRDCDTS